MEQRLLDPVSLGHSSPLKLVWWRHRKRHLIILTTTNWTPPLPHITSHHSPFHPFPSLPTKTCQSSLSTHYRLPILLLFPLLTLPFFAFPTTSACYPQGEDPSRLRFPAWALELERPWAAVAASTATPSRLRLGMLSPALPLINHLLLHPNPSGSLGCVLLLHFSFYFFFNGTGRWAE